MASPSHGIKWWLAHLEEVSAVSDGYLARCPAHDDIKPSLHITLGRGGEPVVHCFAGCEYQTIVKALNGLDESPQPRALVTLEGLPSPLTWWETYTGVPKDFWITLGMGELHGQVTFEWHGLETKKLRNTSKKFTWIPEGTLRPWLWPTVPSVVSPTVWICEGESDCGVLRYCGHQAFSVTKGAQGVPPLSMWTALKTRGAKEIVLIFDQDPTGIEGATELVSNIQTAGIDVSVANLGNALNIIEGEKDVRDLYKRVGKESLIGTLKESLRSITHLRTYSSLWEFLTKVIDAPTWLVDNVWLKSTIGGIFGSPKIGKSWLSLDLGLSIASGTPFLGTFPVHEQGVVVYVPKEDPAFLLHDRVSKILVSKGFGGHLSKTKVKLPARADFPWVVDLSFDFQFTPERTERLLRWLNEVYAVYKRVDLVIFDPILRMMVGIDEYKASEVSERVFLTCDRIRREVGAGTCLVHHRSKAGTGISSYGSMAFRAFSEVGLYILGDDPLPGEWVGVRGEYKSAVPTDWAYRFGNLETQYEVEVRKELPRKLIPILHLDRVAEALSTLGRSGATVQDLMGVLKMTETPLREALRNLVASRKVKVVEGVSEGGRGKAPDRWVWEG